MASDDWRLYGKEDEQELDEEDEELDPMEGRPGSVDFGGARSAGLADLDDRELDVVSLHLPARWSLCSRSVGCMPHLGALQSLRYHWLSCAHEQLRDMRLLVGCIRTLMCTVLGSCSLCDEAGQERQDAVR